MQLRAVGFTDELLAKGVAALSGGWKMKLALARAMLQKADILLLDEPTNHLDVHNVAWLQVCVWIGLGGECGIVMNLGQLLTARADAGS